MKEGRIYSRKLWITLITIVPSLLSNFGINADLLKAIFSDAQEKVAIAAGVVSNGSNEPSALVYVVAGLYVIVQGYLDYKKGCEIITKPKLNLDNLDV